MELIWFFTIRDKYCNFLNLISISKMGTFEFYGESSRSLIWQSAISQFIVWAQSSLASDWLFVFRIRHSDQLNFITSLDMNSLKIKIKARVRNSRFKNSQLWSQVFAICIFIGKQTGTIFDIQHFQNWKVLIIFRNLLLFLHLVLKLATPVDLLTYTPICLPLSNTDFTGKYMFLINC